MTFLKETSNTLTQSRASNPAALAVLSGGVFWTVAMVTLLAGWTMLGALSFAILSGTLAMVAMAIAYDHFNGGEA